MLRTISIVLAAATALTATPVVLDRASLPTLAFATAQAAVDVDVNIFFDSLSPHGVWIPSNEYNFIWVPTSVDKDWAPYTNGRWIYTEQYGWYFVSDEPFAWAVYHYGRWAYDPLIGWYWVPGTKFAGAWVAWRRSENVVGWAPLPPQGNGYAVSVNVSIDVGSVPQHRWRFVQAPDFLKPQISTVVFAGDRRPEVFRATQPAGTVIVQNNVIVNNVININFIEQQTKQKVEVAKVETVDDPKQSTTSQATPQTDVIKAFVAEVKPADKSVAPPKVVAKTEVQAPTKGQADAAAVGNQPGPALTGTPGAQPNTPPANPRCTDADFAKANPKDCPPANNATAATTPPAGTTPSTGGAGAGAAGQANANANAGTTTPPANASGQGSASATATAPGSPRNPRCSEADFARANPNDCAAPGASGNAAANASGNAGAPGNNQQPGTSTAATPQGNRTVPSTADDQPPKATAAGTPPANPRCADATFARNNPRTCATTNAAPSAGGSAGAAASTNTTGNNRNAPAATGSAQGQGNAAATANVPANPPSAGGNANANANATANPNAGGNARCSDPTFARNNPRTCPMPRNAPPNANVQGNAAAGAGTEGTNAGSNASGAANTATAPRQPGQGGQGNVTVQGNTQANPAARCVNPAYARANPTICRIPGAPQGTQGPAPRGD
jgi:hypothetical protein